MSRTGRKQRSRKRTPVTAGNQPIVVHPASLNGVLAPGEPAPQWPDPTAVRATAARDAAPAGATAVPVRRVLSVDALRGINLALMIFAFALQADILPPWMYHRQTPGPTVLDIPGITWQDVPFLSFVFTLAAALPITLRPRIDAGTTELGIIFTALRRGFLMLVFALLIGHSNTYFIGFTQQGRVIAIVGFVIMCMLFTRRREDWNESRFKLITNAGWIAAIAFLVLTPAIYGESFSLERRDQIIIELLFAAITGTIVWYFTRDRIRIRLAILAATIALYTLAHYGEGTRGWWYASPADWLVRPSYLALLTVVIPGTIAGDWIVQWMRTQTADSGAHRFSALLATLCMASFPLVLVGMYNRWIVATFVAIAALTAAGAFLLRAMHGADALLLRRIFFAGAAILLTGIALDPVEDGIRKVPETLSWFFTSTGMTMLMLAGFIVIVDLLRHRKLVQPLIDIGQNSMFTYVVYSIFLNSVLELIPALRPVMRSTPELSVLRSVLSLALVMVIVRVLTRRRIVWRT